MSKMDIGSFLSDTKGKSGGKIDKFDLKSKGKAIIFLHPNSGIYKRDAHWFPVYAEVLEDGKKVKKVFNTCIVHENAKDCLICQLRKSLRENEDIDMEEVILRLGKGKDQVELNKGEIIGAEGYGWKKNLAYKTEYLFGIIDSANPDKVYSFTASKSLGKKITKVIEDQIEEEGEEDGNPFKNPYAIKITYDKSAQSSEMYDASWNKFSLTEEIKELLETEGIENEYFIQVAPESKVAYLIKESLVYDEDALELDLSSADEFDPNELNRSANSDNEADEEKDNKSSKNDKKDNKSSKNEKPVKKETKPVKKVNKSNDEDSEDEENEEDKKPIKKEVKTNKKEIKNKEEKSTKPNKSPKKKQVACPNCDEMVDEDATECPHCEAEFDDTIECPSCGKDIPSDSTECPECGEEVVPF